MYREAELSREEQRAGAEEGHVLARAAVLDGRLLAGRGQAAGRGLVTDGVEPRLAERRHGPDQRDVAEVERRDQVGDRAAEGAAGLANRGEGILIALCCALGEVLEA